MSLNWSFFRRGASAQTPQRPQTPQAGPETTSSAETNPVVTLAVCSSSSAQPMEILNGTMGELRDGNFHFDPILKRVSYLFTLNAGKIPATPDLRLHEQICASGAQASALKLTVLSVLASRWAGMYERAGLRAGAASSLLAAEEQTMCQSVRNELEQSGHVLYEVPVNFNLYVEQADSQQDASVVRATTLEDLRYSVADLTISVDAERAVERSLWAGMPGKEQKQKRIDDVEIPPEARNHWGSMECEAGGVMCVYARTPDDARAVASAVIEMSHSGALNNNWDSLVPSTLQNPQLMPFEDHADEDAERYY